MSEKNIYQRINAVMKEVAYIKKDKQVDVPGQKYKAVTHDQVISVLREKIVQHGIVIYPEQLKSDMLITRDLKSDIKMHLYSGDYAVHFVSIDNADDRLTVTINAQAADNGDKAPGKCATYATKTAMLKVFSMETGEDDESRAEAAENAKVISYEQGEALAEYCVTKDESGKLVYTKTGSALLAAYKIKSIPDLPASKFNEALERCKKRAEAEK